MIRTILVAVSASSIIGAAKAAPITYEINLNASYGSAYGGSPILAPIDWTFGFTYDPDTITPTSQSALGYNSTTFYDGSAGVTGYLRKGSETANVEYVEAQFGRASLNRHSFTIRYVIDTPVDCGRTFLCDTDQNDGLSLTSATGGATAIDVNRVQFTFGGNQSTPNFFTGPGTLADTPLDWLGHSEAIVSGNMSVFGYGIAGSPFGGLSMTAAPTGLSLSVTEGGGTSAVPLPAGGLLLVSAIGGLAAFRRRGAKPRRAMAEAASVRH